MPQMIFSPRALLDMERLALLLRANDADAATDTVSALLRGLAILMEHPLIWLRRVSHAGNGKLVE